MKDYTREQHAGEFNLQSLQQLIRALGGVLGLIVTVFGLIFAIKVFLAVYGVLQDPEQFKSHLEAWSAAVGGKDLDVNVAGISYRASNVVAILALGGGTLILVWISMGLLVGGAKILYWALSDREAVRKLLVHAFGPAGKAAGPNEHGAAER